MFSTYLSRGLFKPRLIFARINGPIVSYQCFVMVLSVGKLENIFVRNIGSFETKQVLFYEVKKGEINWKHDVSATMFSTLALMAYLAR